MAVLHNYSALWEEYPDYIYYTSPEVKELIGGNVDAAWITNTCAVRLSRTLNYNAVPVPRKFAGLTTVKGGDGMRYAFRVREMRKWLDYTLGTPDFDHTKKAGDAFSKTQIAFMKGIIAFDIQFTDATGHLDLWDGTGFSSEVSASKDYFISATRVSLWKTVT
jgi:hypothetical protein